MFESFLGGFAILFNPETVVMTFVLMSTGLFLGMFVGALPGFTTLMALAILLPISFFIHPLLGIPFLLGVYKGGIYGGSIPAILVSMPGTGAAVATTFDGPALTKKGEARKALEIALFSSVTGDLTSDLITIALIGPIAAVALLLGPPELAAILMMALIVIAGTSSGVFVKGLLMLAVGLFLGMIGQDPIGALSRFSFGITEIEAGIPILPMLIGLFALPEIFVAIEKKATEIIDAASVKISGARLSWLEFKGCLRTIFRSTAIGTSIGMIPGVGQVVAAFMGYAAAKSASKTPEKFGKGELEGIAAAEAANNAVNGPTLVPLLTLGIPGDNLTVILVGAFIAHGLRPGPQLMEEQGPLVFAILIAMVLANILFIFIGYICIPLFAKVVTIRKSLLLPLTLVFAFAGTWVFRSNPYDLAILVIFGALGYMAKKLQFDVTPLAMGFILGQPLEYAFGQTVILSSGNLVSYIFLERPITAAIIVLTPLITYLMWRRSMRLRRQFGAEE
ncbi:MAG: tripartite tricarboxylate transporter permease [Rhodospirillaceae bacterium]|jgi:putative tricarboxylic transport membrane protein|nr:tripartite tricarboxylate transporter permease [Rhodospirillaceae bacterium]MBT3887369.1 tripartite tricarboxylate transporter permease [Rhodospirillaceae bacterium]MBT4116956.1 tripartite tricarboxylate transporter permease [Rhodospirillaceae bacterium]MBT4674139.1 tripartite tricarboxylate transporter permease [Rhodospirillaceae bacterium]MBT4720793.1 tripartite tricarboxylate transporter permease [Rhodospirillaceae bacterium]